MVANDWLIRETTRKVMPAQKPGKSRQDWKPKFYEKINKSSDCWFWTGVTDKDGYGKFYCNDFPNGRSHRIMFFLMTGKSPNHVCHTCDNPACVNPQHLFAGNVQTNTADREHKGRGAKGSNVASSKLTESQVIEIKHRLKAGELQKKIAKEFGLCKGAISHIATGRNWSHV